MHATTLKKNSAAVEVEVLKIQFKFLPYIVLNSQNLLHFVTKLCTDFSNTKTKYHCICAISTMRCPPNPCVDILQGNGLDKHSLGTYCWFNNSKSIWSCSCRGKGQAQNCSVYKPSNTPCFPAPLILISGCTLCTGGCTCPPSWEILHGWTFPQICKQHINSWGKGLYFPCLTWRILGKPVA